MIDKELIKTFNEVYEEYGFYGVLEEVESRLQYGKVKRKGEKLWSISTGGFSEDEELIENLLSLTSRFGYFHYVGNLRGGIFYFSENEHDQNILIIQIDQRE